MPTVVFGLSFQAEAQQLPPHRHCAVSLEETASVLTGMTTIFRMAFRSMFSDARVFELPRRILRRSSVSAKIVRCCSFRATTADINGRSTPDYLLIVVAELSPRDPAPDAAQAWRGFRTLSDKFALLKGCGLGGVLDSYTPAPGRIVGQNSFVLPDGLAPDPEALSEVFAFYFLAWLTCLRIERSQLRTQLTVERKALSASAWRIANQRLRIINLSRYFLTADRTNDPDLKAICIALSEKFKLQLRYDRALTLHREFEHHLDNTAKIIQSQQLGSVSNILFVLTIISLPIAFLSAFVAVSLKSEIFTSTTRILSDYRIYALLAVGLATALVPLALLKIYDKIRSRQ